jgi:hypothetical protein
MTEAKSFYNMLRLLLREPCLILMLGKWRQGKTDTSLLIGYLAKKWKLIDKIGSNIWTFKNPDVEYIISMGALRRWLHFDRLTKLFVFDEALTHLPSRTAMSKKNVSMIGLVTELSKAHGRMIFCAQTDNIDSALKDSAFLRAVFYKQTKKVMSCHSSLFEPITFRNIPRSPIRFDKDRLAEFSQTEGIAYLDLSDEVKCATLYSQGLSMTKIRDETHIHEETVKRNIRKVLKAFLEREQIQIVNSPNQAVHQETS